MSNDKLNYKNILNSRKSYLRNHLKISILNDEQFLNLIKKQRFQKKTSATELDLTKNESILKQFNSKHNLINKKIMNQIQTISKKVYENNVHDKNKKMLNDLLFIKSNNEINFFKNKNNKNRQNSFHFSSSQNKSLNSSIKKNNEKKNNFLLDKKNVYLMKTDKKKSFLPPINKYKLNIKRIKLNINNEMDKNEEETMMKLYKELEFQNKNKFVI